MIVIWIDVGEGGMVLPNSIDLTLTLEVILVVVGFFWYALNRRARNRQLKVRLATATLTEVGGIGASVEDVLRSPGSEESLVPLPTGVYDGLTSSTNISYFDEDSQKKLHELYYSIRLYNEGTFPESAGGVGIRIPPPKVVSELLEYVKAAHTSVRQFRDRYLYRGRWRGVLKFLHWYYDD